MNRKSIKSPILSSMGTVLLLLLGGAVLGTYLFDRAQVRREVEQRIEEVENIYRVHVEEDFTMLETAVIAITQEHQFHEAVKARDRKTLRERATPLYWRLRDQAQITHMYFSGPDRVNLLRIHEPNRYGDVIDRFTTREAERTGEPTRGIELGPLGTLTMRMVFPCSEEGTRVGYLELGHEMSHLGEMLARTLDVVVVLTVRKEFLDREGWEAGMRMLGRKADWDQLPDAVVTSPIPEVMREDLPRVLTDPPPRLVETTGGDRAGYLALVPVSDAEGRDVGYYAVWFDVQDRIDASWRLVLAVALGCAALGTVLVVSFAFLVDRIERTARAA